jgi:hypothetical protein
MLGMPMKRDKLPALASPSECELSRLTFKIRRKRHPAFFSIFAAEME